MVLTIDVTTVLQGVLVLLAGAAVLRLFQIGSLMEKLNGRANISDEKHMTHAMLDETRFRQVAADIQRIEGKITNLEGKLLGYHTGD